MATNWDYDPDWKSSSGGAKVADKGPGGDVDWKYDDEWKQPKQNRTLLQDLGTDIKRGAQQLPGALTGIADISVGAITGERHVSRAADALGEMTGFQPGKWAEEARSEYSDRRQQGSADIDRAWEEGGVSNIASAYARNPGNVAGLVAESLPSMVAGGLAGRAVLGAGRAAGAIARPATAAQAARQAAAGGAVGEGAVIAGQTMDEIGDDVDARRAAAAAVGAGAMGGALGYAGGRMAQRMGLVDAESAIAGGLAGEAVDRPPAGLVRRMLGGAITEGVFEELPQSVQEQMWQNWAEGRELMEGVPRAAVEGTLAGAGMGAGANVLRARPDAPAAEKGGQQDAPVADDQVAGLLPAPVSTGTPAEQILQSDVDRANAVAEADARAADLYQRRAEVDAARAPLPSEQMGLDPATGPMSAAAALAVDSGAADPRRVPVERERDFVPPPAGSFGAMNEFADLLTQERSDAEARRQQVAQTQEQRRDFEFEEADRRVAEQMQREAAQRRRAVLDAVLEDPQTSNPAERFAAVLARMGFRDAEPTPDELTTISRFESVRDAEPALDAAEVEPSAPNELDAAAVGIRERAATSGEQSALTDGQAVPATPNELDAAAMGIRERNATSAQSQSEPPRLFPFRTADAAQREVGRRGDGFTVAPHPNVEGAFAVVPSANMDLVGEKLNRAWTSFAPNSGTLGIPRAQMPQIRAEHRGAMVQFMNARGVAHAQVEVAADSLMPTQAEFSPGKVRKAKEFTGGDRSILASSDGYVLDGHHQWLAKREAGETIKAIQLDAPIRDLIALAHEFPISTTARGATQTSLTGERTPGPTPAGVAGVSSSAQPSAAKNDSGRTDSLARTASWAIRNKETGEVVAETFDRARVDALNTQKYEAIPIQEHLASLIQPTHAATAPEQSRSVQDQLSEQSEAEPERAEPRARPSSRRDVDADRPGVDWTARELSERAQRHAESLRAMAPDAGWAEEGGRLLRDANGEVTGRSAWVPRANWFAAGMEARPDVVADLVEQVLAGKWTQIKQHRTVEGMIQWLEAQESGRPIDADSSYHDMEAAGYEDLLPAVQSAIDAEFAELSEADAMAALGFTQEEINEAFAASRATEAQVRGDDARRAAADEGSRQDFDLASYSQAELAEQEAARVATEKAETEARTEAGLRAQADAERNTFTLTGSDRSADVLAAQGQTGLFDASAQPAASAPQAEQASATTAGQSPEIATLSAPQGLDEAVSVLLDRTEGNGDPSGINGPENLTARTEIIAALTGRSVTDLQADPRHKFLTSVLQVEKALHEAAGITNEKLNDRRVAFLDWIDRRTGQGAPVETAVAQEDAGAAEPQAAQPEAAEQAQETDDRIRVTPGKGLIKGKFLAEVDGMDVPGGPWDTQDAARNAALQWAPQWRAVKAADAEARTSERRRKDVLVAKLRAGGDVSAADLDMLGLRAGSSDLRWFIPAAADLFGIPSRAVRPLIQDQIRVGHTDMGAKREFVTPDRALRAMAAEQREGQSDTAPAQQAEPGAGYAAAGAQRAEVAGPRTDAEKGAASRFLNGPPIKDIKERVSPEGGFAKLREWAVSLFKAAPYGGKARNPILGEVLMDERSVRDSMGHKMSRPKAEAFAAVPDVIERGMIVLVEPKSPELESIYIAAPVRIGGVDDVVTVLVHRDVNAQRMYLHSVATKESLLATRVSGAKVLPSEQSGSSQQGGIRTVLHELLNFNRDAAADPSYTAQEPGTRARKHDNYTKDLFGNPVPATPAVRPEARVEPASAENRNLLAAAGVPGAKFATVAGPRQVGTLKSGFEKIESASQAAHALAGLRKMAQEHFAVLVLGKDRKPLAALKLFAGATSQTSVYPEVVTKAVYEIPGAAHIWYAHNHPSGRADPSDADIRLTKDLSTAFGEGTGITVDGHVIIAGTRAVEMDADGTQIGRAFDIPARPRRFSTPITERKFHKVGTFNSGLSSPDQARRVVRTLSGGQTGVVFLNSKNEPVAFLPMPAVQMQRLRDGGNNSTARQVFGAAARSNASAAILHFADGVQEQDVLFAAQNMGEALEEVRGIRVLDALHEGKSFAEAGVPMRRRGDGAFFRSAPPDSNAGSVDRVTAADAHRLVRNFVADFPGSPEIVVAARFDQLPADIQKDARDQQTDEGAVKGAFNHRDGKVYVVSGNHRTIADLEATVFHEVLGHAGVRKMFGKEFVAELNKVFLGLGGVRGLSKVMHDRGMHPTLVRYVEDVRTAQKENPARWSEHMVRAVLTEEVFAHIAESGNRSLRDRFLAVVGQVRQWLRDHGFVELSKLGESDLLFMLSRARETMRKNDTTFMRSFAGDSSETSDRNALASARQRVEAGEDAETVRQDTGWHQGADGKWRYEISDDQASVAPSGQTFADVHGNAYMQAAARGRQHVTVGDVLQHDALYAAYPQLRDLPLEIMPDGVRAQARLSKRAGRTAIQVQPGMGRDALASALLHELQHGIQTIEGFAVGGSRDANLQAGGPDAYRRLAGEVEARNVQARRAMSDEHRRIVAPDMTADTDSADVIVTFNGRDVVNAPPPANARSIPSDPAQAVRITPTALVRAFEVQFPRLAPAVRTMLERGRRGEKGGVVLIDSTDTQQIARTFASKTGRSMDHAVELLQSDAGAPQGFFDPRSGLTFLVGPQLDLITAPAVLLHEMTHGQQRQKIDARAMAMVENRSSAPAAERAFLERVAARMNDAGETGNAREATAYIVEQALIEGRSQGFTAADSRLANWVEGNIGKRVAGLVRAFMMAVRGWMVRNGMPASGQITVDDLVSYAMAGVERAARGDVIAGRGGQAAASVGGDALAHAAMPRQAATFAQAREQAKAFQGKPLTNIRSGITAMVSRNNLDKMLSVSAVGKSTSAADQSLAVANLDRLFEHAEYGWMKQDRDGDPNIVGVHRLFAPMDTSNGTRVVKLTVKEFGSKADGSRIYSVESMEIESPASIWVAANIKTDGLDSISTPYAGRVESLIEAVQKRNAERDGEPGIHYSIAGRADPAYFDITAEQEAALRHAGLIREPKTWRARLNEMKQDLGKRIVQGMFDQYAPLRELDDRAYILARMSKGTDGTLEALMFHGKPVVRGDTLSIDTSNGGLMDLMASLNGEQDRFLSWIAANRADKILRDQRAAESDVRTLKADLRNLKSMQADATGAERAKVREAIEAAERMLADAQRRAEVRELLFSSDQIEALKDLNKGRMRDGKGRAMEYGRVLRQFNAIQDSVMAIAEARGIIDSESRAVWRDSFYVPFYRNMEDGSTGPSVKSGLVGQHAFKKLRGSRRQLNEDLLANVLKNWAHLLDASAKNHAAVAAIDAAIDAGIADPVPAGTKDAVKVLRNGAERYYAVADPFVFDAITSMENVQVAGVEKVLAKFKNLLTAGVTMSPSFQVRSLLRDSIHSLAVTPISANPGRNVATGMRELTARNKSQTYADALVSGGLIRFNSLLEGDRAEYTRRLIKMGIEDRTILDTPEKVKMAFTRFIRGWHEVGNVSESTNRMALYKQRIDSGVDPLQAAFEARDLMDYSMQGSSRAVRFLAMTVPFLNARLQGLYKLGRDGLAPTARTLKGTGTDTDKAMAKRFGSVIGAVSMASILLMLAHKDDDDWKRREDWDRDMYWWFKLGDTAFRIPKPFEVGAIGTLAERTAELMVSDEMTGARFANRLGHMIADTFSLNPMPQAVKPLIDVYANKDSFTGRPIEGFGMERLQPSDRYTANTSEIAKALGGLGIPDPLRLIGGDYSPLSPVQVDALIRGYFGWLGTSATRVVDEMVRTVADRPERPERQLRDWFLIGSFVETLPTGSSRYLTHLYEQSREIEQAWGSYRAAVNAGDSDAVRRLLATDADLIARYPAVSKAKRQIGDMNRIIRLIHANPNMSAAVKRRQIDRIRDQQHRIAQQVSTYFN